MAVAAGATVEQLRALAATALRLAPEQVPAGTPLSLLGLDSLAAADLRQGVELSWGVELDFEALLCGPTLEELAATIARCRSAIAAGGMAGAERDRCPIRRLARGPDGAAESALSFAQERLWFLDQLEPGNAAYNQPAALRLTGPLDAAALAASLGAIRRRHEALRTRFVVRAGDVVAVAAPPMQPSGEPNLPLIDLCALPAARRPAQADRLAAAEAARPFDLAAGPPLRAVLLRLAGGAALTPRAGEHRLLLTIHHIATDGRSLEILARELAALYAAGVTGEPPAPEAVPELPIQYADFASWQRQRFSGELLAAELAYWRGQLAGPRGGPPPLELPADRPRTPAAGAAGAAGARGASGEAGDRGAPGAGGATRATGCSGGHCVQALPPELACRLAEVSRRAGATRFMTLLAAFAVLLERVSGTSDVAVGTPVANRGRRETRDLIGLFVNTVVLRLDLAGDPELGALLAHTRRQAQAAYAHQEVPFDRVVGELAPRRALAETPFFRVFFAQQPAPPVLALPGLAVEHLDVRTGTAKFDLSLAVAATAAGGLTCTWTWRGDLFEPVTVKRLAAQLHNLLAGIAAAPDRRLSELPLFSPAERHQLLVEWNAPCWAPAAAACRFRVPPQGAPPPDAPPAARAAVPELIAAQAARRPHTVAVRAGTAELTYGELAERAAAVAGWLRCHGVGPEAVVGLWMDRSLEAVVGTLAILAAGGVYLPLDPVYPAERLELMLAGAGAVALLTQEARAAALPPGARQLPRLALAPAAAGVVERQASAARCGPAAAVVHPEQAAYVLYTSGSTGAPKGVVVSHRSLANRILHDLGCEFAAGDRYLFRSSIAFDVSLVQMLIPFAAGGSAVIALPGHESDARYFGRLLREDGITHASFPSTQLDALLADPELADLGRLLYMAVGVEAMPPDLPARFFRRADPSRVTLWHRYGPTEATIAATQWRCAPGPEPRGVPIGRPFAGATALVLDAGLRPVPIGVPGELAIGGPGVARGYLGDPALTAERFLPDPLPGAGGERGGGRLYRTGDLARWRRDGALEFLGRIDRQVKIRGFRVEPGEIAAALATHPAVGETVVVTQTPAPPAHAAAPPASPRLVGYYTLREPGGGAGREELRAHLRRQLPDFMLPSALIELAALPLTPTGKVDVAALPRPPHPAGGHGGDDPAGRAGGTGGGGGTARDLTATEEVLAAVWRELLGIEQVGPGDNFFELGGDSLLSIRVVALARAAGLSLAPRDLFERQTLAELAALPGIEAGEPEAAAEDATAPAELAGFELDQAQLDVVLAALALPPEEGPS
jgi:amino acid adenylation domain-containing protein